MRKFAVVSAYRKTAVSLPRRSTSMSAGYDLASAEDVRIGPKEIVLVPTGLKALMPSNEALFVFARSSMGIKRKLMLANSVGIIDADYYDNEDNEGHIFIPLYNFGEEPVRITAGERIAQGVFLKYLTTNDEPKDSTFRLGGFGSSGR
ncbi:MAG: dUTP diphosphatase [Acholeplasmataceae bacterium]